MTNLTGPQFTAVYGTRWEQYKEGGNTFRVTQDGKTWIYTPGFGGGVWSTDD